MALVALFEAKGNAASCEEFLANHLNINVETCLLNGADVSAFDAEICFPRTYSCSNGIRLQVNGKRCCQSYRFHFDCLKAGKTPYTGILNYHQYQSLFLDAYFIKPVHKLISFGKLII